MMNGYAPKKESYECNRCDGTGFYYNGKCFQCDGGGIISIARARFLRDVYWPRKVRRGEKSQVTADEEMQKLRESMQNEDEGRTQQFVF